MRYMAKYSCCCDFYLRVGLGKSFLLPGLSKLYIINMDSVPFAVCDAALVEKQTAVLVFEKSWLSSSIMQTNKAD